MKQIKTFGKKVVRHFAEAPWESDIMEFRHGLWRGVSPLFTESGRQLGEENTRPFLFNDHIPAKTIPCKYEGSRYGHPINMSALRIAMTNFDAALEITRAVIAYHASIARKVRPGTQGGIRDLYIISLASISLISYSLRKQPRPNASGIVPDDLASQYQFIAGIFMICRDMLHTNSPVMQGNAPVSAAQLYEYADRHKIFTSFNGMVCAGSTKKIMEFLEFCTGSMAAEFSRAECAADTAGMGKDGAPAKLVSIVGDAGRWYHYAMAAIELDCFIKRERRRHKPEQGGSAGVEQQDIIRAYEEIAAYCASLMPLPCAAGQCGYETGALKRQNKILKLLDRKPVSRISAARLAEQLGYD